MIVVYVRGRHKCVKGKCLNLSNILQFFGNCCNICSFHFKGRYIFEIFSSTLPQDSTNYKLFVNVWLQCQLVNRSTKSQPFLFLCDFHKILAFLSFCSFVHQDSQSGQSLDLLSSLLSWKLTVRTLKMRITA